MDPDPLQYDAIAADYEDHARVAPYNALYDRPAVLEMLGDVAGKRVLDAGCGPGFYAADLVRRGAELVACDASAAMIELARARVGDRARLVVHDLEQPFDWLDDESFDVAFMALVLHHVNRRTSTRLVPPCPCMGTRRIM